MAEFAETIDPTSVLDAGNNESTENEIVDPQDTPEVDQPDDTPSDDPETSTEESDEAPAEEGDESEDETKEKTASKGDDDVDLRKAAKELRESLNKLREIDPKAAKSLRQALGHDLAYQESFKTPQDARVAKATIDAIGGTEGLATLQDTAVRFQEQETLSEAGDPALVKNYAKDFPDGFKKAAPVMLDELRAMDKDTYNKVLLPHLVDSLEASGMGNVFNSLQEAAQNGDTEAVKKIAANLTQWLGGTQANAKQLRASLAQPESDAIKSGWDELNKAKEAEFDKSWRAPVGQYASGKIYKTGEPYIRNVAVGQQRAFFQEVIKEMDRRITGDKTYTTQEQALMKSKSRDINKIVAFKNAKIDTLVQSSVEKVAKEWKLTPKVAGSKPTGKPAAKPGTVAPVVGVGSTPQNPVYLKEKPPVADRDTTIKGAVDHQIAGRALMKSGPYKGKWVSWRAKPQA